uniref:C-type lectin domain-containing protein n=1 Tax=Fundulus heteroclitus TaxID=8078 RepID=A0A3Q2P8R5_FUNHE
MGWVVVWQSEGCGFDSSFSLPNVDVPLGKALNPKLPLGHRTRQPTISRTWFEAQQYCRKYYTDLATFENIEDFNRLKSPFSDSWAWIGLIDDPNSWKNKMGNDSNSWRWSTIQGTSQTNFIGSAETCVNMHNGFWYDSKCDQEKPFTCYYGKEIF